ncbi:MAG: NERD domain-containing protein [Chromatiales bacterium]|nr:NERD domain-containing protein [Chromatiales bacterium]
MPGTLTLVLSMLLVLVLAVALAVALWRVRRRRRDPVRRLASAAVDSLHNLLIPSGHDEEVLVDLVLLSSSGLLVIELRRVDGHLFGGEKMAEWTVLGSGRRQTFPNPKHHLMDRVAALQRLVPEIPVSGVFLVWGSTAFGRGRPERVVLLEEMLDRLRRERDTGTESVRAFRPAWDSLRRYAAS